MEQFFGKKQAMTQIFSDDGKIVPVTVIDVSDNSIVGKVNDRVMLGFGRKKNPSNAELGKYKALGFVPEKVKEVKLDKNEIKVGNLELSDLVGKRISVQGISKGKGFQGVVKRWGFKGGPKTHGQSDRHRSAGSIGAGTTPGRVFKGKKMAGRMGGEKITIKNLEIINHDKDLNLIMVKGSVPGRKGSLLNIKIS